MGKKTGGANGTGPAVGGGSQALATLSRRASRVPIACLVDGARQNTYTNLFLFYPITFVNEFSCIKT